MKSGTLIHFRKLTDLTSNISNPTYSSLLFFNSSNEVILEQFDEKLDSVTYLKMLSFRNNVYLLRQKF